MVHTQEMEQKNALQIKVSFGEEIRRLTMVGTSFKMLVQDIKRLFALKEEASIIVKYLDDDKDLVTMSSDEELKTAISLANGNLLRIEISRKFAKKPKSLESNSKEEISEIKKESWDKDSWRERKEKVRQFKEKLHAMQQVRLVKDVTFSDNSTLAPSTQFVKTWKIRNESESAWPEGCTLTFHKGDNMGSPNSVPIAPIAPGQEIDISIALTSPATLGKYVGVWRFTTPPFVNWKGETIQKKFGTPLKVKIIICDPSSEKSSSSDFSSSSSDEETSDEEKISKEKKRELKKARKQEKRANKEVKKKAKVEEMATLLLQLESMGFTDKNLNIRMLRKTKADLDKAVVKLLKKGKPHK